MIGSFESSCPDSGFVHGALLRGSIALALVVAGCTVDADVSGKACPCGDGWICDPAQQICVSDESGEISASNWTHAFAGVYLFEQNSPSLGADVSGNELHLQERFGPQQNTVDFMQGAASLEVSAADDNGLESDSEVFASPAGTSMTYGGWFRATGGESDWISPVHRLVGNDEAVGYQVQRNPEEHVRCYVADGTSAADQYATASARWPMQEWIHAVCRFDNQADQSDVFVAGSLSGSRGKAEIADAPVDFSLSSQSSSFTGQLDEVFFANRSLADEAIERIWACGVDGSQCRCRADQPSEYVHCGRADPSCAALVACDAPAP